MYSVRVMEKFFAWNDLRGWEKSSRGCRRNRPQTAKNKESPIVDRWNAYMADVLELVMDPATGAQPKLQQMFLLE